MCVTRYKDSSGSLLPANDQKVIWIDGLSINPKQLSQELEPVGICVSITGNKAMVRYRKEELMHWSAVDRFELQYRPYMNNDVSYTYFIKLDSEQYPTPFTFKAATRADFVSQLNKWFLANNTNWSAELVELDTDLPAFVQSDNKDEDGNYLNRIIINAKFTANVWHTFEIIQIIGSTTVILSKTTRTIGKHIVANDTFYKNNGFKALNYAGCCYARYYNFIDSMQIAPKAPLTSINSESNNSAPWPLSIFPVKNDDFEDNAYCQILRDNFVNYNDYLESWMVKYPCGLGGVIKKFPSGKENTYKLANCTFEDVKGVSSALYPAANHVANISVHGPNLGAGKWWLPSPAELVQMMHDITYEAKYKDNYVDNNTDIVNRVLDKMRKFDSENWDMLSAHLTRWMSSRFDDKNAYRYDAYSGCLHYRELYYALWAMPITIYEF